MARTLKTYTVTPGDSQTRIFVEERGKKETRKVHKVLQAVMSSRDSRILQDELNALADQSCKGCNKTVVE